VDTVVLAAATPVRRPSTVEDPASTVDVETAQRAQPAVAALLVTLTLTR
jgi:hypothetical protein